VAKYNSEFVLGAEISEAAVCLAANGTVRGSACP
jgi:hypothetical protein